MGRRRDKATEEPFTTKHTEETKGFSSGRICDPPRKPAQVLFLPFVVFVVKGSWVFRLASPTAGNRQSGVEGRE